MRKLRVIQWTTGKVGKMALRGIMDDPRLELVGVYAYSADKVGQDAGAICGRPNYGVRVTNDIDALIALKADSVVYAPYKSELSHVVRLLENGADVVSTNLLSNIGGLQGTVKEQIEAACKRGNSSLYITGINPGWLDTLAAVVTPICKGVESISITESVSVAHYESPDTWKTLGFGASKSTPELVASARGALVSFRDSVERVADALHYKLDGLDFSVDYATATKKVDLGWFSMEKGTHAALRGGWIGLIKGKPVISNRVIWYMTKDLEPAWEIDKDNYHVDIKGEPDVNLRVRVTPPKTWTNHQHGTVTAMPAVSAIVQVKAAPAGILGLKGAGLPYAPAGLWHHAT